MEQSLEGNSTRRLCDSPCSCGDKLGILAAHSDCPNGASAERMKEKDEDELLLRCDEEVDYDEDDGEDVLMQDGQVESEPAPAVESEVIDREEEDEKVNIKSSSSSSNIVQVEPDDIGIKDDIQKMEQPLYALRRNPKRSQRFIDEEYTLDISASLAAPPAATKESTSIFSEKAKACTECGKEFSSWKALFGHMRCHPEREWRGIQRPDNLSHYHQQHDKLTKRNSKKPKPPSLLVLDHEELESSTPTFMKVASDNESDTESIEAAYMNGCCNGFSKGKITGKRSKRPRQTSTMTVSVVSSRSCLQHELAVTATTPTEVKEERDMANCLVMLACAGRGLSNSEEFVQSEEEEDSSTNDMNGNGGGASWSSDEEGDVTGLKNSRDVDEDQQQQKQHIAMASHHLHDRGGTGNGGSTVVTMMGSSSTGNGGFSTIIVDDSSLCGGGNGGGELLNHEFETSGGSAAGVRMKYECSTCKRIFKSHQALGGHRASHKKVKGCFARTNLGRDGVVQESAEEEVMDEDFLRSEEQLPMDFHQHHQLHYHNNHHHHHPLPITSAIVTHLRHPSLETGKDELGDTTFSSSRKFMKGHECSICHRVFTSGQALGGHKRCHWGGTDRVLDTSTNFVTESKPGGSSLYFGQVGGSSGAGGSFSMSRTGSVVKEEFLDLNLPAPVEDEDKEGGEEDDVKINNKDNRNNNNNSNSPNNDMEMVYKLPQLVPASALKRNAGAMSSFNAYLDIDKCYLHKDVKRKVVVEEQQQQPQQQQHLDKIVSGGNKVEFRCFSCEVSECVFSTTESLNAHHNTQHTADMVTSISGLNPISAS